MLTTVLAPDQFVVGDPTSLVLRVSVEGRDVDPLQPVVPIEITVEVAGERLEIRAMNAVYSTDVLLGDAVVGLELGATPIRGPIQICAQAEGLEGNPCAVVELLDAEIESALELFDTDIGTVQELREVLAGRFPGTGCRCASGELRLAAQPATSPDDTLGDFTQAVGGNVVGPYHSGNTTDDDPLTSTMKLEAHFKIEITNPPEQGQMSDDAFALLQQLLPSLCPEQQDANRTVHFLAGTPREVEHADRTSIVGATVPLWYPYDPSRQPGTLQRDSHGYIEPGRSPAPFLVGKVKSHDGDLVHWLDAPGINNRAPASLRRVIPVYADHFFHMYVHGTTNTDADNCDCYVGIRSAVIAANGNAAAPVILSNAVCE